MYLVQPKGTKLKYEIFIIITQSKPYNFLFCSWIKNLKKWCSYEWNEYWINNSKVYNVKQESKKIQMDVKFTYAFFSASVKIESIRQQNSSLTGWKSIHDSNLANILNQSPSYWKN